MKSGLYSAIPNKERYQERDSDKERVTEERKIERDRKSGRDRCRQGQRNIHTYRGIE